MRILRLDINFRGPVRPLEVESSERENHQIPCTSSSRAFSVLAKILPYAEQENLQDLIDFEQPIYFGGHGGPTQIHPANEDASRYLVPMFRCPSDGQNGLCPSPAHRSMRLFSAIVSTWRVAGR
jgi:hypothetical protein